MTDDEKKYPLINTDIDKWPNDKLVQLAVTSIEEGVPYLKVEDRKIEIVPSRFTIDGLKKSLNNIDNSIAVWQANKKKFEQLLAYAEAHGVVKDEEEGRKLSAEIAKKKKLEELEKKEKKTPEDFVAITALKRELAGETNSKKDAGTK